MASYSVFIKPSAAKEIERVPLKLRRILVARIARLATEPRPAGCEKLTGTGRFRIRQGDYRAVYEVSDENHQVIVVKIGNRRDVYR